MSVRNAVVIVVLVALGIAGVAAVYGFNFNSPPIRSDGYGYYLYYPGLILFGDPTLVALADHLFPGEGIPGFTGVKPWEPTGGWLIKYPIGTALLGTPVYLATTLVVATLSLDPEPMGTPYQVANVVNSLLWFAIGSAHLMRLLTVRFDSTTAAFVVVALVFGTSVFHYATYDGSFSHIYSYAIVSILLWRLYANASPLTRRQHAFTGLLVGLLVIVRPTNAVFGLFYLAYVYDTADPKRLAASVPGFLYAGAGATLPILVQMTYWFAATGIPIVYSYGGEGFDFASPHLAQFLFSVRKGAFVWSPIIVLCLCAVPALWRHHKSLAVASVLVLAILTWMNASWRAWYFGGSFGSRVIVDLVPVLALPLAATLARLPSGGKRTALIASGAMCVVWTMIMMVGYWRHIVPYDRATTTDILNALAQLIPG